MGQSINNVRKIFLTLT
jgi:hypothetical protein